MELLVLEIFGKNFKTVLLICVLEFDNLEKLNGLERGSHETFCFFLGVNWVLWDRGPSCRPPKWGRLRVLRGILAGMINKCKMDALWKHIR